MNMPRSVMPCTPVSSCWRFMALSIFPAGADVPASSGLQEPEREPPVGRHECGGARAAAQPCFGGAGPAGAAPAMFSRVCCLVFPGSEFAELREFCAFKQVSHELIRIAILWHEMWHEALEEASRLYFGESNVEGMLNTLIPLHEMMDKQGPSTLKEIAFVQAYGRELQVFADGTRGARAGDLRALP